MVEKTKYAFFRDFGNSDSLLNPIPYIIPRREIYQFLPKPKTQNPTLQSQKSHPIQESCPQGTGRKNRQAETEAYSYRGRKVLEKWKSGNVHSSNHVLDDLTPTIIFHRFEE